MKTLPEEMIGMLEEHCEKLQNVEEVLYELATGKVETAQDLPTLLKSLELWMQSQAQLRITALELQKQSGNTSRK